MLTCACIHSRAGTSSTGWPGSFLYQHLATSRTLQNSTCKGVRRLTAAVIRPAARPLPTVGSSRTPRRCRRPTDGDSRSAGPRTSSHRDPQPLLHLHQVLAHVTNTVVHQASTAIRSASESAGVSTAVNAPGGRTGTRGSLGSRPQVHLPSSGVVAGPLGAELWRGLELSASELPLLRQGAPWVPSR